MSCERIILGKIMTKKQIIGLLFGLVSVTLVVGIPTPTTESLVVLSPATSKGPNKEGSNKDLTPTVPKIYGLKVDTNVTNRFATTLVTSKVKNLAESSQEASFTVVLPETAYISGFVMEVDGKSYRAYVKEKEEAKKIYDQAVSSGLGAAHVEANARDSNRFTVSVNIEPQSKATFYLTYEELLQRQNGQYDIVINIHPGQPVKDLAVEVNINETRPLKFVRTPSLRSGNEISKNDENLDPNAEIEMFNSTAARVKFIPDLEKQKQLGQKLGGKEDNGLAGQFIVQYDVNREADGGEVLVSDGYFVHFFAPSELKPLKKRVVFILDTSGSMYGNRIIQLKEAMKSILSQLNEGDSFDIIDFGTTSKVWNIPQGKVQYEDDSDLNSYYSNPDDKKNKTEQILPATSEVTEENVKQARKVVDKLNADGGTNILSAIKLGLQLINKVSGIVDKSRQPIIIFLTDGEPTVGETNPNKIISGISETNIAKVPIFSLSFGDGADRAFLEKLSLRNQGFARHIYEAADASLQLQAFYKYISSPLLSNVQFKYVTETVAKLTRTIFPILFDGSEIVVCGTVNPLQDRKFEPGSVTGLGIGGSIVLKSRIQNPIGSLEKHWAYLTIKQLLEDRDAAENKTEFTKKALDIALKYSFVTPVTSLVVVKPNTTTESNTEDASKDSQISSSSSGSRIYSFASTPVRQRPAFTHTKVSGPIPLSGGARPLIVSDVGYDDDDGSSDRIFGGSPSPINIPLLPLNLTTERSDSSPSDSLVELKRNLTWLDQSLKDDGTLQLSSGNFKLVANETIDNRPSCPKTPLNTTGECTLLKDCPLVHHLLTDFVTYTQYFCPLKVYAGVCCPIKTD